MRFFIFLIFILLHTSAYSATSCEPGYWFNQETAECELCPAGYYCPDGITKKDCYDCVVPEHVTVVDSDIVGGDSVRACKIQIDPGWEVYCDTANEDIRWLSRVQECSSGGYCPGGIFQIDDLLCSSWGNWNGKDFCPIGTYDISGIVGATSVEQACSPCPNSIFDCNTSYGEAACESEGNCGYARIFASPGFLSTPDFMDSLQITMISSGYNPNTNNGLFYVLSSYDTETGEYSHMGLVYACDGGYWAPNAIEYYGLYVVALEGFQEIINGTCVPVDANHYSPNWVIEDMASLSFAEAGLERYACPSGTSTTGYGTGADSADDCRIGCDDGYAYYDGQCLPLCGGGISHLHIGNDVSIPLFADRHTTPALNVMFNDQICFINVAIGTESGTLNINHQGTLYHAVK